MEHIKKIYSISNNDTQAYEEFVTNSIHQRNISNVIQALEAIYTSGSFDTHFDNLLKDLAHLVQNHGDILRAYKFSSELLMKMPNDDNFRLLFFERLQDLLFKLNSRKLNRTVISQIDEIIKKYTPDPILEYQIAIAKHRSDFFNNTLAESIANYTALLSNFQNTGIQDTRLKNHVELSSLMLSLIDITNNERCETVTLEVTRNSAKKILEESKCNEHNFNLNRACYIYAIACLLDNSECHQFTKTIVDGIDQATTTNYNFFIWKYHNLKALYFLKNNNFNNAYQEFENAFNLMNSQGFLFLGDVDPMTSNIATLSNYVTYLQFFHSFQDETKKIATTKYKLSHLSSFNNKLLTYENIISLSPFTTKFNYDKTITIQIRDHTFYIDSLD
jgi:hypothetical protein